MTIDQVIDLGKNAEYIQDIDWFSNPWWVWIVCPILIILIVIQISEGDGMSPVLMIVAVVMILVLTTKVDVDDQISRWEKKVAAPYVNSLPVERKEIVFIKIDPEMTTKTNGSLLFGGGYIDSRVVEKTPITVSFKDNGVVTRTDWYQTKMELTESEKPYIEFQRLDRNLGHSFKKGLYNVRVHLPESYEFTDIK